MILRIVTAAVSASQSCKIATLSSSPYAIMSVETKRRDPLKSTHGRVSTGLKFDRLAIEWYYLLTFLSFWPYRFSSLVGRAFLSINRLLIVDNKDSYAIISHG